MQNSQIRELAVLFLYEHDINQDSDLTASFQHYLANRDLLVQFTQQSEIDDEEFEQLSHHLTPIKKAEQVKDLSNSNFADLKDDVSKEGIPPYLVELITGIYKHQEELDQMIDAHIQGRWSVQRLEKINLQILRLAVYEMCYSSEEVVPNVVALSEALELAKRYSDDASRKFINGVLANILADLDQ